MIIWCNGTVSNTVPNTVPNTAGAGASVNNINKKVTFKKWNK